MIIIKTYINIGKIYLANFVGYLTVRKSNPSTSIYAPRVLGHSHKIIRARGAMRGFPHLAGKDWGRSFCLLLLLSHPSCVDLGGRAAT